MIYPMMYLMLPKYQKYVQLQASSLSYFNLSLIYLKFQRKAPCLVVSVLASSFPPILFQFDPHLPLEITITLLSLHLHNLSKPYSWSANLTCDPGVAIIGFFCWLSLKSVLHSTHLHNTFTNHPESANIYTHTCNNTCSQQHILTQYYPNNIPSGTPLITISKTES